MAKRTKEEKLADRAAAREAAGKSATKRQASSIQGGATTSAGRRGGGGNVDREGSVAYNRANNVNKSSQNQQAKNNGTARPGSVKYNREQAKANNQTMAQYKAANSINRSENRTQDSRQLAARQLREGSVANIRQKAAAENMTVEDYRNQMANGTQNNTNGNQNNTNTQSDAAGNNEALGIELADSSGLYQDGYWESIGHAPQKYVGDKGQGLENVHDAMGNNLREKANNYILGGGYAGDVLKLLDENNHKDNLTSEEDIKWYNSIVDKARNTDLSQWSDGKLGSSRNMDPRGVQYGAGGGAHAGYDAVPAKTDRGDDFQRMTGQGEYNPGDFHREYFSPTGNFTPMGVPFEYERDSPNNEQNPYSDNYNDLLNQYQTSQPVNQQEQQNYQRQQEIDTLGNPGSNNPNLNNGFGNRSKNSGQNLLNIDFSFNPNRFNQGQ